MPLSDRLRGQPPFFWIALAVGTALLALYALAISMLVRSGGREVDLGWKVEQNAAGRMAISEVTPGGPADGRLTVGDLLFTVNGHPYIARGLAWLLFMDLRPGDRYRVGIEHDGNAVERELTVGSRSNLQKLWLIQVPLLVVSFAFSATGLGVALISAHARVARLYATLAFLVGALLIPLGVFFGDVRHGTERVVSLTVAAIFPFVYPAIYQFFAEFPPGVPRRPFWNGVSFLLFAWAAAFFPVNVSTNIAAARGTEAAASYIEAHPTGLAITDVAGPLFQATAVIAIVGVIVRNYRAVDDAEQRRRLRWVFAGSVVAAGPFLALFVADVMTLAAGTQFEYYAWLRMQNIAQLFLVLLPITFTYAVVANRVVGVDVVVRRGIRYVLARNVLRAAVFIPLLVVGVSVVLYPNRTVTQILFENPFFTGLAIAAAVGLLTRDRLERALDRRFFRDAAERDRLMLDLVHELAGLDDRGDVDTLVTLVTGRIERALHARDVRLIFDEQFPADADAGATGLVVPIRGGTGRMLGVLLLGEKKSEEPYSREDRRLLEAVAAQIAVARENATLRRTAADEARVKVEVLARIDAARFNLLKECPSCGACYDQAAETCQRDGQALSLSLPVDRTIEGRYRLEQRLGRGGMGIVYGATDLRLDRPVAIKIMRDATVANDDWRRRFEREARACARLHHDHIVTVYDYGTTGHDVAYLVMERLAGNTLRALLHSRGSVAPASFADWCEEMLDGVGYAHDSGIIHRDLKPENVFLRHNDGHPGWSVTLLDFGIAKMNVANSNDSVSLTMPGTVLGTLAYMSPEQLLGRPVDARTDLYSIGVVVFEAVSGRSPFCRVDAQATIAAVLHESAGLTGADPGIAALDAVLQRSLAKDRAQRFSTAHEMRAALLPALRSCPPLVPPSVAGDGAETTL